VTPLFPWLGPIGAVPLPSQWIIEFSPMLETCGVSDQGPEPDENLVADLADVVRDIIQDRLDELVAERGPAFG
jgi:hypothetical protein